ncbi:hypothetical protein TNCV_4749481 [Trichonephila clavipes]|nr:hypothetical protein TNCV_4749481 [Trichonephila clavipes]
MVIPLPANAYNKNWIPRHYFPEVRGLLRTNDSPEKLHNIKGKIHNKNDTRVSMAVEVTAGRLWLGLPTKAFRANMNHGFTLVPLWGCRWIPPQELQ